MEFPVEALDQVGVIGVHFCPFPLGFPCSSEKGPPRGRVRGFIHGLTDKPCSSCEMWLDQWFQLLPWQNIGKRTDQRVHD